MIARKFIFFLSSFYLLSFIIIISSETESKYEIIYNSQSKKTISRQKESHFPESLILIENEAFDGTSITIIYLPENAEAIGEYAFSNIHTLQMVIIHNKTSTFCKNSFKGSENIIVSASSRSIAHTWAIDNQIPFIPTLDFYDADADILQIDGLRDDNGNEQEQFNLQTTTKHKLIGRTLGELNVTGFKCCGTFHIQGHSPPNIHEFSL